MINDHLDSERINPLPPLDGRLFSSIAKSSCICTYDIDRIAHTTAFVKSVVVHWLKREIA